MTLPFENDTGPVIKKLAARSIQTDKRRNLFVIVTIALAAASGPKAANPSPSNSSISSAPASRLYA